MLHDYLQTILIIVMRPTHEKVPVKSVVMKQRRKQYQTGYKPHFQYIQIICNSFLKGIAIGFQPYGLYTVLTLLIFCRYC